MGKIHSSFGCLGTADALDTRADGLRRHRLGARDGQALVEFALIVPLFLLLILGVVDFGRAYNYKNDLTSLVNQAARFAEVNSCAPCSPGQSIEDFTIAQADSGELRSGSGQITAPMTITYCFLNPSPGLVGKVGDSLKVTAHASYNWLPFLHLSPTTVTLDSSVVVRIATKYDTTAPGANFYSTGSTPPTCP